METSFNLQYALPNGAVVPYWIRLEEKPDVPETVSFEEVAGIANALFNVEPCIGEAGGAAPTEGTNYAEQSEEEILQALKQAFSVIGYDPCKYKEGTFTYEKDVFIYRSHTNPYNLVLNEGRAVSTAVEILDIDDFVEVTGNSITLDYHILNGRIKAEAEVDYVDGSTVFFTQDVNQFIRIQYQTQYEIVRIKVLGKYGEAQECHCLAFYQLMIAELTITQPEEDEEAVQHIGCGGGGVGVGPSDPGDPIDLDDTCYKRYIYRFICRCSQTVDHSFTEIKMVSCDTPFSSENIEGVYDSFQEAEYNDHYIICPEEEGTWEGADAEFYEDTCCDPPPLDWVPPICRSIIREWSGGEDVEGGREGRGDNVMCVPVSPPNGICGTLETIYEVEQQDCCDDPLYEDIVMNTSQSVDIIADYDSGVVMWELGNPNFTVTVRGSGFYTDVNRTKTSIIVYSRSVRIYTKDACGSASITINDGCSEVSYTVRATDGNWQVIDVGWDFPEYSSTDDIIVSSSLRAYKYFSNSHRIAQYWSIGGSVDFCAETSFPCEHVIVRPSGYTDCCTPTFPALTDGAEVPAVNLITSPSQGYEEEWVC